MTHKQNAVAVVLMMLASILIVGIGDKIQQTKEAKQYETYRQITIDDSNAESKQTSSQSDEETRTSSAYYKHEEWHDQLKGLKPYIFDFQEAGRQFGIDYKLLVSIAALESGWGESHYAKANNNIFGWCSGEMKFESVRECIFHVAEFLKTEYLTPGGRYFEGYEIADIAIHYNENPPLWTSKVTEIYENLEVK